MTQRWYIGLVAVIICLTGVYFLAYRSSEIPTPVNNNFETSADIISEVLVNQQNILGHSIVTVSSETLHPEFKITFKKSFDLQSLRIDGLDILGDTSLKQDDLINNQSFSFRPTFLLEPGHHELDITALAAGETYNFKVEFIFAFKESFDQANDLDLFILPDSTTKTYEQSWYVKDGKLNINRLDKNTHASLAFLYPMGDVDVSFEVVPQGANLSLAFYFLDNERTIVLGNGGNRKISLLRGNDQPFEGKDFLFDEGEVYDVRIVRQGVNYALYLKKVEGNDWQQVIDFDDSQSLAKDSTIGFTLWPGSDGVQIDNLTIQ